MALKLNDATKDKKFGSYANFLVYKREGKTMLEIKTNGTINVDIKQVLSIIEYLSQSICGNENIIDSVDRVSYKSPVKVEAETVTDEVKPVAKVQLKMF